VINAPIVNAIALPGGQVLLFSGLIHFAAGPNEVAGVLAHEFGHIEFDHPMQLMVERGARAFLVGLLLGDVFGGSAVAGVADAALNARFSQAAERAADARAVQLLDGAGLDIGPFGIFFERMGNQRGQGDSAMSFLNSHPPSEERARLIAAAPRGGRPALDEREWAALNGICD
jgi:predicted Zn-dependent protease